MLSCLRLLLCLLGAGAAPWSRLATRCTRLRLAADKDEAEAPSSHRFLHSAAARPVLTSLPPGRLAAHQPRMAAEQGRGQSTERPPLTAPCGGVSPPASTAPSLPTCILVACPLRLTLPAAGPSAAAAAPSAAAAA